MRSWDGWLDHDAMGWVSFSELSDVLAHLEEPGSGLNSRAGPSFTICASKDKALGVDPWAGSPIGRKV